VAISLEHFGTDSDLSDKKGLVVVASATYQDMVQSFPVTRNKTATLIQEGWSDSTNGFLGVKNFINNAGLQGLLAFRGQANNPCIQISEARNRLSGYIKKSNIGLTTTDYSGVAGLGPDKKVPLQQLPSMGSGYLLGPYGAVMTPGGVEASSITSGQGPQKIAEWPIQSSGGVAFQPMVYMIVNAKTDNILGRPVIEVKISDGQALAYSSMYPTVAVATGRTSYTDIQTMVVLPSTSIVGQTNSSYSPNQNIYLTAWLYDSGVGTSSIENTGSSILVATAFLMRVAST
jgi:hypothetical protein